MEKNVLSKQRNASRQLSPIIVSPIGNSSSKRDENSSWAMKSQTNILRLGSQSRARNRRKPILPGGKLQPLFKNHTAPSKPQNAQNSEQFPVLPQISGERQKFDSEMEIFSGVATDLQQLPPTAITMYLCYDSTEMAAEAKALMKRSEPLLRQFCSELGFAFHFVDPNLDAINRKERFRQSSKTPNVILTECQKTSLGPNFVLLLGYKLGQSTIVSEIEESEFSALSEAIAENSISNGHLLASSYMKDTNCDPPSYLLQQNKRTDKDYEDLVMLLRQASSVARDAEKLTEEAAKRFHMSAIEEDVSIGILQNRTPRMSCLAYFREIQKPVNASETDLEMANMPECTRSLWKNVEKYLGQTNTRGYLVKMEDNEGYLRYLEKLCSEFVSDAKELILQNAARFPAPGSCQSVKEYVRMDVLHHVNLCARKAAFVHGQVDILEKLKSFLQDPKCSNQPFIIHGQLSCGKSTAMANVSQSCRDWFSGDCVTVTRFLGTSVDSGNIHDVVTSITLQICFAYGLKIPDVADSFGTLHKALTTFRATLDAISKEQAFSHPLIIFLDGIDRLRPYSECLAALWAVKNLPPNVHVVLSSIGELRDANFLGALVTLVTDPQYMAEIPAVSVDEIPAFIKSHLSSNQRKLSSEQEECIRTAITSANNSSPLYLTSISHEAATLKSSFPCQELPKCISEFLYALFDRLENEFGRSTVKYFVSYLTVAYIGILDEEVICLMSLNKEVEQNLTVLGYLSPADDRVFEFPAAVLILLKHRLSAIVEPRLVHGRSGFGWSQRQFGNIAAERYSIIIDGTSEERLLEETTKSTLLLHEHFVGIYLRDDESTFADGDATPYSSDSLENSASSTISFDPMLRANRLLYHLKVLLPVKGLALIKRCLLFDYGWLQTRLSSVFSYSTFRDILAIRNLGQLLVNESVIDETTGEIDVIFEFLQQTFEYVSRDTSILAVEIVGRLSSLAEYHQNIACLIKQAEKQLRTTNRKMLAPLTQFWDSPGSLIRHVFSGPTHFLGYLQDGEVAVFFSARNGVSVWRIQTGELLHHFSIGAQQSLDGMLLGHSAEFLILTYYSHINRVTEFTVWSTETGLLLLSSNFQREFEAIALGEDDQLMAVATLVQANQGQPLERCILGIAIPGKDVVFRLVTGDLHKDGVSRLMLVRNVKRETVSVISFGRSSAQDVGFWDLEMNSLDFSLQLNCTAGIVKLNSEHKTLICACPESGKILMINLVRGIVDQTVEGDEYVGLTDVETRGEKIFVATQKSGIFVLSLSEKNAVKLINVDKFGQSIPVKLLSVERSTDLLFIGYDSGMICIFEGNEADALIATLQRHSGRVNSLSLTKEGQLLSSSSDGVALLWNFQNFVDDWEATKIRIEKNEENADEKLSRRVTLDVKNDIQCLIVMSNDTQVITGSKSGLITIWDAKTGGELKAFSSTFGIDHLYVTQNERLLVVHCVLPNFPTVRVLQVWEIQKGEILPMEESSGLILIYCSAVTPSGDRLITIRPCKDNGEIGIVLGVYDLNNMKNLTDLVCNIYGSMDAQSLRIIGFSSNMPRQDVVSADKPNRMTKPAVNKDGENVKTSDAKGLYLLLDYYPKPGISFFFTFTISGKNSDEISMDSHDPMHINTARPECSVICPNETCVSGSVDGKLVSWNFRSQKTMGHFVDLSLKKSGSKGPLSSAAIQCAHGASITCLEVDSKKGIIISGAKDCMIKLWNLSSRKLMGTFSGHQGDILCVRSCMQNSMFISSSADETLSVWRLGKSHEAVCTFRSHGKVNSAYLTSDKERVVALLETETCSQFVLLRSINL